MLHLIAVDKYIYSTAIKWSKLHYSECWSQAGILVGVHQ